VVFLVVAALSIRNSLVLGAIDFQAFYCSGMAVSAGDDSYRVEPLRTCEHQGNISKAPMRSGSVVPAPLPGYDLAVFVLFAKLPYPVAVVIWQLLLWSAVGATVFALMRLTGLAPATVIAATLLADGYISSFTGQLAPFSVAGIALSASCASRKQFTWSALWGIVALCEPHVAVGSLLALLLFVPASRWAAAIGIALLGALTFAATGFARSLEYVRDVLPRHALSEVAHERQYSLTGLLHLAHVGDPSAVLAGELSFVVMLIAGLIVAVRLRAATGEDGFLIVIPPAFTLIGGAYIHDVQIAAAIPAALLLYAKLPERRVMIVPALLALSIPWTAFTEMLPILPVEALAFGFLAWSLLPSARIAVLLTAAQLGILVAVAVSFHFDIPHIVIAPPPTAFSEDAWRMVVDALFAQSTTLFLFLKLPTWCGLALVAVVALKAAATRRPPPVLDAGGAPLR
jgi:hypothetical protein